MKFLPAHELLQPAWHNGYAVPAFCAWNAEVTETILQVATDLHAPVIWLPAVLGATKPAIATVVARWITLTGALRCATERCRTPAIRRPRHREHRISSTVAGERAPGLDYSHARGGLSRTPVMSIDDPSPCTHASCRKGLGQAIARCARRKSGPLRAFVDADRVGTGLIRPSHDPNGKGPWLFSPS